MAWCWRCRSGRIVSVSCIFFSIIIIGVLFVWRPVWQQQSVAAAQLQATQNMQQQYQQALQDSRPMLAKLPALTAQNQVASWLLKSLAYNHLQVSKWQPEPADSSGSIAAVNFHLQITGSYNQLLQWLNQISAVLFCRVNQFDIAIAQGSNKLHITLQLLVLFRRGHIGSTHWQPGAMTSVSGRTVNNPFALIPQPGSAQSTQQPALLKTQSLEAMQLVGIIGVGKQNFALIKVAPDTLYTVAIGDQIGNQHWQVQRIVAGDVVLRSTDGKEKTWTLQ